jgi:hypothetical protein
VNLHETNGDNEWKAGRKFKYGLKNLRTLNNSRLRRRSSAARLLGLWVRIPPGTWMFVCCERCVLSGRKSVRRIDHSSRGVLPTVARHCVWSRNLEHEKAKARYRAVKIQPQWVVTAGKQTNKINNKDKVLNRSLFRDCHWTSPTIASQISI